MDDPRFKMLLRQAAKAERSPRRVVFMGRQNSQFNDNCKYAFLHCARNCPELDCLYVSADLGVVTMLAARNLPAQVLDDPRTVPFLLSAGVLVCDDFFWKKDPILKALLHPAKTVQLWHGIPLKAIGFPELASSVNMTPEKAELLTDMYSGYDTVLSTSPYFTEKAFARAFRAEAFAELGYPRNDVLLREPGRDDMLGVDAALYGHMVRLKKAGWKTLVFMPTFRDGGGGPIEEDMLNLGRLHQFGQRHKIFTVLKLHPYVELGFKSRLPDTMRVAAASSDAYPLLRLADALLTDYSSVYFDFLLTDRPIVFYPYDFERYCSRDRELLFDYKAMTPGPEARDADTLFSVLEAVLVRGEDDHGPARRALAELSFSHRDGHAAERLGAYILRRFNEEGVSPCKQ
jgi:CDP-glycerol glycerophosphotransferase